MKDKGILIKLTGLIPSKKNSRITVRRTGRSFPSAKYRKWQLDAMQQLHDQFPEWGSEEDPIFQRVRFVRIHLWYGTKRKADNTNKAESVMDLLVDAGILVDDNWHVVRRSELSGRYRKNRDGALVRIVK